MQTNYEFFMSYFLTVFETFWNFFDCFHKIFLAQLKKRKVEWNQLIFFDWFSLEIEKFEKYFWLSKIGKLIFFWLLKLSLILTIFLVLLISIFCASGSILKFKKSFKFSWKVGKILRNSFFLLFKKHNVMRTVQYFVTFFSSSLDYIPIVYLFHWKNKSD